MASNATRLEKVRSSPNVAVQEVREVMDIRQASEYLGISADSLYRYASENTIPGFRLGNRWRFKKSRLDSWMDEQSGIGETMKKKSGRVTEKKAARAAR